MKFSISLQEFHKLIQKVLPAIPPKTTMPILEHLHFSLSGDQLSVIATDQDITIKSVHSVGAGEDGEVLVPGRKLNEIIKLLDLAGNVEFNSNVENFEILLKTTTGKYIIKGLNPNDYLNIPELFHSKKPDLSDLGEKAGNESDIARFKKGDILKLSTKTVFAVSTDEFRPAMTGVLFQFRDSFVTAVATDSYRLAKVVTRGEAGTYPLNLDIIIPARSVELLKKVDSDVIMSLIQTVGKITHARFDFGDTVFITRIIDEKFPPYESVIPGNNNLFLSVNQKNLVTAIQRVSTQASFVSKQVRLTIEPDNINISSKDEETGAFGDENLECEFNSDKFEIGFNFKYLLDAIEFIDTDEESKNQIVMTFSEPTRPVLIKPKNEQSEILMLIMPVRLS